MGTHPIFESDFDCQQTSVGFSLNPKWSLRRLDPLSRTSSPGSTPSTFTSESIASVTNTAPHEPSTKSANSPRRLWEPKTSESTPAWTRLSGSMVSVTSSTVFVSDYTANVTKTKIRPTSSTLSSPTSQLTPSRASRPLMLTPLSKFMIKNKLPGG